MIGVCVVITVVIEFTLSASAHHHKTFSPLFVGSMIEIVSRIDIVADGEYDIFFLSFSPFFIGSMIEIVSRIDIVADGEYSDSMVTDV